MPGAVGVILSGLEEKAVGGGICRFVFLAGSRG
jgi:hypothetical protein